VRRSDRQPGSGLGDIADIVECLKSLPDSLLKKSEIHPNPSFRRKPESSLLLISLVLIFWTPAPGLQHAGAGSAGVTKRFSTYCYVAVFSDI